MLLSIQVGHGTQKGVGVDNESDNVKIARDAIKAPCANLVLHIKNSLETICYCSRPDPVHVNSRPPLFIVSNSFRMHGRPALSHYASYDYPSPAPCYSSCLAAGGRCGLDSRSESGNCGRVERKRRRGWMSLLSGVQLR